MIITITTDASFSVENKLGAYAFWISCNGGRICHSGLLKEAVNVHDCELKAIANAVHAVSIQPFEKITRIVINTDSTSAIGRIKKHGEAGSPEHYICELMRKLSKKHPASDKPFYSMRHVKAHSGVDVPRKYVNAWCDKEARRVLRAAVKQLKEQAA